MPEVKRESMLPEELQQEEMDRVPPKLNMTEIGTLLTVKQNPMDGPARRSFVYRNLGEVLQ